MEPEGVIRPILLPCSSANQTLPSGPVVIPAGALAGVGSGNSVMVPAGVIRPIALPDHSVNQRLPSGTGRDVRGKTPGCGDRETQ